MSQPAPTKGKTLVAPLAIDSLERALRGAGQEALWEELSDRLRQRIVAGFDKYGCYLETENGRDPLQDAWEELADAVMYLHQEKAQGDVPHFMVLQAENLLCSITKLQMLRRQPK